MDHGVLMVGFADADEIFHLLVGDLQGGVVLGTGGDDEGKIVFLALQKTNLLVGGSDEEIGGHDGHRAEVSAHAAMHDA